MSRISRLRWLAVLAGWTFLASGRVGAADPPSMQVAIQGNTLTLSWGPAAEGARYTVQTSPTLVPAQWQPLGGEAGWPTTATRWSGPLPGAGAAFYRVLLGEPALARGTVITNVLLKRFTSAELLALFRENNLPFFTALAVDAWKVIYATIDAHGAPTRASALVVVPQGASKAVPIASYQHGTLTLRDEAPSRLVGEADLGLILGASGYLTVLPDYLGMGDSPGLHPYQHAKSEATAVVDALRAVRGFLEGKGATWNRQLFLTGYSQGGHATLAAQREIELWHTNEFTITASAPSAGAYDSSGTMTADFLSNRRPPNPYYYAYFLAAYVDVYGIAGSLGELLRPPYDTTLPPLFDGLHDGGEINALMPPRPADILKPEVLEAFSTDPNHPLRVALRENDLHTGWYPKVPTRFYHCAADEDVPAANSKVAYEAFKAAGAPAVELVDPQPGADHGGCAPLALLFTKFWFDTMKQ